MADPYATIAESAESVQQRLSLIDRGADLLVAAGSLTPNVAEALRQEPRRRVDNGENFGSHFVSERNRTEIGAMKTYIALFRGINVPNSHVLPMKALKLVLEKNGCVDVQTYIRSGNVILRSPVSDGVRVARLLTACVSRSHGFEPRVLVLTPREFDRAVAGNPFAQAEENPTSVHLFFLAQPPKNADLKALDSLKTKTEAFALKDKIFYLYTPDGFGKSKLATRAERLLGVEATARNWRTVITLLKMVRGMAR